MSKLYLDTANLEEITRVAETTAISGITTNPSLMAKEEKGDYIEKLQKIAAVLDDEKHLSVEVITLDPVEMLRQAIELAQEVRGVDLHIKIPVMLDTLPVITKLTYEHGINVNATACMTAEQAKMALDAGAPVVSFFYNRMKDGRLDANHELYRFWQEFNIDFDSESSIKESNNCDVICGSIRKPADVLSCWESGAQIVTASMKIIEQMITHPQTDKAIQDFQKDIEAWLA